LKEKKIKHDILLLLSAEESFTFASREGELIVKTFELSYLQCVSLGGADVLYFHTMLFQSIICMATIVLHFHSKVLRAPFFFS
jgi:hypothetical protein